MTDSHRELKGPTFSGGKNALLRLFLHTGAKHLAPMAITQAVKASERFLGSDPVALHPGDNFHLPVPTGLSWATLARCACPSGTS